MPGAGNNADGGRGGGSRGTPGSSSQVPGPLISATLGPSTLAAQARMLPIAYGTVKLPVYLLEMLAPTQKQVTASATGTQYAGVPVASDGSAWLCLKSGSSTHAPTGQGADPNSWQPVTGVSAGDVVQNGGNVYQAVKSGTTGVFSGPTGTGTNIPDNTTAWMYLGTTPFPIVVTADNITFKYLQKLPYPVWYQLWLAALCEGEVTGALSLFWDQERYGTLSATDLGKGLVLYKGPDAGGQVPQPSPGVWDASGYQHVALIGPASASGVSNGSQKQVPSIALELQTVMLGSAVADPSPADIVNDLLTHTRRGCSWPSSRVDATTITGSGASSFRTYCDAAGFRFSMLIDSQRSALSILADILNATNSDAIWSQGKLKIIPLSDQNIASPVYGSTAYVAPNTAQYNLSETDFLEPIQIEGADYADCFNSFPVEYFDRSMVYQRNTVEDPDQVDLDQRGMIWRGSTVSLPFVFPDGTYPIALSRIYAQRSLKIINTYTFKLPERYGIILEPTNVVTISDAVMGLSLVPVRIVSMREESDFTWTVVAEDYPNGVAASGAYTPQAGDGFKPNEVGTSAGFIPSVLGTGAIASPGLDNIWPNPTSEISPPSNYPVANDGNNAEFDYRANVGAAAHTGNWVRQLDNSAGGSALTFSFSVRESQDIIGQFSAWVYVVSGAASIHLDWLDASGAVLSGKTNAIVSTGSWIRVPSTGQISGRAPAGTATVRATLSADPTSKVYFDDISFRRLPPVGPVGNFLSFGVTGSPITIDASLSDHFECVALAGASPTTINSPTNGYTGQEVCIKVKNSSGGALPAIAWGAAYKMAAFAAPATGNSRSFYFKYDGTNWIEVSRTPGDVPN